MRSAVRLEQLARVRLPAARPDLRVGPFPGTVASTDTTSEMVTVNVTSSIPNGLLSGADTFDVGSQTIVLGNSTHRAMKLLPREQAKHGRHQKRWS